MLDNEQVLVLCDWRHRDDFSDWCDQLPLEVILEIDGALGVPEAMIGSLSVRHRERQGLPAGIFLVGLPSEGRPHEPGPLSTPWTTLRRGSMLDAEPGSKFKAD